MHSKKKPKILCTTCERKSVSHWRRKWQPTPVFLPGKPHGWRSLVGYCPWSHKESDTTEWLQKKKKKVLVIKLCLTLCDPIDCNLPSSSVQRIIQARILAWAAIPFSRDSSWPGDQTLQTDSLLSEPPGKSIYTACVIPTINIKPLFLIVVKYT